MPCVRRAPTKSVKGRSSWLRSVSCQTAVYAGTKKSRSVKSLINAKLWDCSVEAWRCMRSLEISKRSVSRRNCDSAFWIGLHAARDTPLLLPPTFTSHHLPTSAFLKRPLTQGLPTRNPRRSFRRPACPTFADPHRRSPSSSGSEVSRPEIPIALDEGTRTSKIKQPLPPPMDKPLQLPLPLPLPHQRPTLAAPWLAVAAR